LLKNSMDGVYRIAGPENHPALPLIFDSPHSGRAYPPEFNFSCDPEALQRAEDNEVDLLFDAAPAAGATLLCAEFPRTFIDVNRQEDDLDPELLGEPLPPGIRPGSRSSAGIGLVRRLVRPGLPLYNRKLGMNEVRHRIENYYRPYHEALGALIEDAHYNFGVVWHINCHSMPSNSAAPLNPPGTLGITGHPDFVLGDRDGTSCDPAFTYALRDFLKTLGYRVALNNPYKGVELVRRHGRPQTGHNSLQIEIGKALYWNEFRNRRNRNYNDLKTDIGKLVAFCASWAEGSLTAVAAD
jgi:N-formylglutamate amidohydrolase